MKITKLRALQEKIEKRREEKSRLERIQELKELEGRRRERFWNSRDGIVVCEGTEKMELMSESEALHFRILCLVGHR